MGFPVNNNQLPVGKILSLIGQHSDGHGGSIISAQGEMEALPSTLSNIDVLADSTAKAV